ncbi:MAG TPA: DNA polymerase III subunit gamma/tau [Tepiditoga sp.]|nr:DNA polymerase III subunit gamma/tau [Tepiditoga sp.]
MNQSLYRKYRPGKLSEIFGQEHIKKYFTNAVMKNQISHAYIFNGPRGTGKTTVARIIAKTLNCKNPDNGNPCGLCSNCTSITSGNNMDVIELDAASNRGIDEIRQIRDSANYRPVSGNFKVYIIDEFHMLTKEAFNALLKTLEEPPEHVVFILATTNLEKVPETIISRTQLINFKNISKNEIIENLKKVSAEEKIDIDEESLDIIAKKANGGMRDALSMLEQTIKFSGEKISKNDTLNILGLYEDEFINDFINFIKNGNVEKTTQILETIFEQGKDPEVLLEQAVEKILKIIHDDRKASEYIKLAREFTDISKDIKYSENKRVLFEVKIILLSFKNNNSSTLSDVEKNINSQSDLSEFSGEEKSKLEKISDTYFSQNSKKFNPAIYYAIKISDIKEEENRIYFNFDKNSEIAYEILKKYSNDLKLTVNSFYTEHTEIFINIENEIKSVQENNSMDTLF